MLFAGPPVEGSGVVGERYAGFREACVEAGLEPDAIEVAEVIPTFEDGREFGARLLREHPRVTAVFATADVLAIGMMAGLSSAGVTVPRDLSIVGFDDLDVSAYTAPGLTTVAQDMPAKVAEAARIILDEIEKGEGPREAVSLGVELVERGTVAPPRA